MKEEYIIINKSQIEKRIEELKESLAVSESENDNIRASIESFEIKQLEWCLSQSTLLIPEIEKAFDAGKEYGFYEAHNANAGDILDNETYISNLKLDI